EKVTPLWQCAREQAEHRLATHALLEVGLHHGQFVQVGEQAQAVAGVCLAMVQGAALVHCSPSAPLRASSTSACTSSAARSNSTKRIKRTETRRGAASSTVASAISVAACSG